MSTTTNSSRWVKGVSGNLAGRKSKGNTELRSQLRDGTPAVIDKLMVRIDEGDVSAMRIWLDRTVAPLKPIGQQVEIEGIDASTTPEKASQAIVEALANSKLTIEQASDAMTLVERWSKIKEHSELEQRIKLLEDKEVIDVSYAA